jgi:hypothetical protein
MRAPRLVERAQRLADQLGVSLEEHLPRAEM